MIGGIAALLFSLYLLTRIPIFESLDNKKWRPYYNRVPIDVSSIIALIFVICTVSKLTNMITHSYSVLYYTQGLVTCTILVTLTILQVQCIAGRFHHKDEWKTALKQSVVYRVRNIFRESFLSRSNGVQITLLLGIIFASGFGIMVVCVAPPAIVVYLPLFALVTVPALTVIYKRVGYLNRIVQHTTDLVRGKNEPALELQGKSVFATLAGNVNQLKYGIETSQAAQAKSERFKTDLITNVSHDLRTPLTSIITYTELLRDPELSDENHHDYIDIIDRKSKRLKVLIDDLFEASKMASGSVDLAKERVDIVQLLQQALAENEEMITQSTLEFRVSKPDSVAYCVVDGQKLWRVFDNLILNILKYSLAHTRVYISIKTSQDKIVLTFKNITKYELSENIDELFERFKRGDTSRHTNGSGLGLAIAKSIVDLHGGSLDLEVDGDLFKATITLERVN